MFSHLVHNLEPLLEQYGALGVFAASIIEELIAPIPSTLVVFTSSLLLTHEQTAQEAILTIALQIMLPASLGISIGSLFPYFLARIGEAVAINRFGKWLGVDWIAIEKATAWAEQSKHDELFIILARATPMFPSLAISITCGLIRYPVWKFLFLSFLGSLPRTLILGVLAWWGGSAYQKYAENLSGTETIVLILLVIGAITGYFVWKKRGKSRLSSR